MRNGRNNSSKCCDIDDKTEKGLSRQTNENSNLCPPPTGMGPQEVAYSPTPPCCSNILGDSEVTMPAVLLTGHAH